MTGEEILEWLSSTSFRFRPKTPEVLERARAITRAYEAMSSTQRAALQPGLRALGSKLLAVSGLLAEAALNDRDASSIRAGLVLHVMEDFSDDYRENIRRLVLLAFAAKALGADLAGIASAVLPIASERARGSLGSFLRRDESVNRLESFGIRAEKVDDRWRFVPVD